NTYSATIPGVSGPSGSRQVSVVAYDPSGNPGAAFVIVNIGSVPAGMIPGGVGQPQEAAMAAITAGGFSIGSITFQPSNVVPAGSVISQNPPAGQSLPPGTVVNLVISMGANGVFVPNVVGLSQPAATTAITNAGLTVGTVTQGGSPGGPTPSVLAQSPASGAVAASGSPVALFVTGGGVAPVFTLDVDGSNTTTRYDALTDGLIVIRYLFGLSGTALTSGALGATATRTNPGTLKAYLDTNRPALDIDGNGTADALTDGLLILRYLFGLTGNALIGGAIDPLGTRTTAPAVTAYIQSLMP
ncbi:MAG: PASTA domain-containing protein, partial [Betaproteobacteria bacterium]